MATALSNGCATLSLEQIGEAAGIVWRALSNHGPLSMTKLFKHVKDDGDLSRDLALQETGWLAREDLMNRRSGPWEGRFAPIDLDSC